MGIFLFHWTRSIIMFMIAVLSGLLSNESLVKLQPFCYSTTNSSPARWQAKKSGLNGWFEIFLNASVEIIKYHVCSTSKWQTFWSTAATIAAIWQKTFPNLEPFCFKVSKNAVLILFCAACKKRKILNSDEIICVCKFFGCSNYCREFPERKMKKKARCIPHTHRIYIYIDRMRSVIVWLANYRINAISRAFVSVLASKPILIDVPELV